MRPILLINNDKNSSDRLAQLVSQQMNFTIYEISSEELDDINSVVENKDAALLIIGINNNKEIQFYLNKSRELRIPYIFVKNDLSADFRINSILLPVTNLEEEREKGPYTSSFARHFDCPINIYQPNDYGSKAATNIEAMKTLFNSFELKYEVEKSTKDSSKIEIEIAKQYANAQDSLLIISASRDYGLDDILFGPKEQKIIKLTNIPTMLINPRGDLYALCD